MDSLSISFSGCAWHVAYHFGVTTQIQKYFDTKQIKFLGASSGAMCAAVAACDIDGNEAFQFLHEAASQWQHRRIGPFGNMSKIINDAFEKLTPTSLPDDLYSRLFISVTELPTFRNKLLPDRPLADRAELFKIIRASTYIPLYYEKPAMYKGRAYIDGGLTNNQPILDRSTIKISPYKTETRAVDLHPNYHAPYTDALFPKLELLERLFADGQRDGKVYFERLVERKPGRLPLRNYTLGSSNFVDSSSQKKQLL